MSVSISAPLTAPIPPDLAFSLFSRNAPLEMSPPVFQQLQPQPSKPYKACELLTDSPELQFVKKYFSHQKPSGYGIRRVVCVHNGSLLEGFNASLVNMEAAALKFPPTWDQEEQKALRATAMKRWKTYSEQFSPFQSVQSSRITTFVNIRILPLWHGTKEVDSICSTGFTFFGKHHFTEAVNAGSNHSTDMGFFGSGIYFTNSAAYAALYNSGTLMLSWVAMREPYPVVNDAPLPKEGADMTVLKGKHAYKDYSAHYIPVTSVAPENPKCTIYHPCSKDDQPTFDEYVVFEKFHALPRFIVELQPDLPCAPSVPYEADIKQLNSQTTQPSPIVSSAAAQPLAVPNTLEVEVRKQEEFDVKLQSSASQYNANASAAVPIPEDNRLAEADKKMDDELHTAIIESRVNAVASIISKKKHLIESKDAKGRTPLMLAAYSNDDSSEAICQLLLDAKASPEINDPTLNSNDMKAIINQALRMGHAARLKLFLTSKQNKYLINKNELTIPLHESIKKGDVDLFIVLLDAGADINQKDINEKYAIHLAIYFDQLEIIKVFVKRKLMLESRDVVFHRTPFLFAAQLSRIEICKVLLNAGVNQNVRDFCGSDAIELSGGNEQIVAMLKNANSCCAVS